MHDLIEFFRPHLLPLLYAVVIVALLPLVAGYIVLLERKVMAGMRARLWRVRLRSSAHLVGYEPAGGMAIVSGLLLSRSLRIRAIVEMQNAQHVWFVFLAPIAFFIYLVASIAETNRAPFDLPEAESELVED